MSDLFFLWVGPSCREPLSDLIIRRFASEQGGNQAGELKQETRAEAFCRWANSAINLIHLYKDG